jgi:hypothetical protein
LAGEVVPFLRSAFALRYFSGGRPELRIADELIFF